jgi:hypothetical protein
MVAPSQPPTTPPPPPQLPRWAWMTLIALLALIVGIGAALLDYANGATVPAAILKGGAAFAGSFGLLLAVIAFAVGGYRT